jgi:hypothetical protein
LRTAIGLPPGWHRRCCRFSSDLFAARWYWDTTGETGEGAPVAKVGIVALPLLSFYPPEKEGAPPPPPTHFEVLLLSGRTGWVPVAAVRPLAADHLCYARTSSGDWKIAAIDQASQ